MSRKKSPKRRKKQSKLSRILSSSNIENKIQDKYFSHLSGPEIKNNVKNIISHRFFKPATHLTKNSSYNDIYNDLTPRSTLDNNLYWCLGLVIYFKDDIQLYLDKEKQLTVFLLDGNYSEASDILDEIDSACGVSTWSMSVRGSMWSIEKNHDRLTDFLKEIQSKCPNNGFFHAVTNDICSRYQDSSLFVTNTYSLKEQINRHLEGEVLHFLMFKLLPHDFSFKYDFKHIFNKEKNSSLIDIFSCLVDFISYTITRDIRNYHDKSQVIVSELNKHFDYAPIQGLANHYGIQTEWKFDKEEFELLDQYTCGRYSDIHSQANINGNCYHKFAAFEIFSKSCARHGGDFVGGIKETILKDLVNIFLKENSYNDSVSNLLVLCHSFYSLTWFKELFFLVIKETQFLETDMLENISTVSSCYSSMNSPLKMRAMPDSLAGRYLDSMEAVLPQSVSVNFYKLIRKSSSKIDDFNFDQAVEKNRIKKYESIGLMTEKKYDSAIVILKDLIESEDLITRHEASKLLSDTYVKKGDYEAAIDLFVNKSIDNSNLILCFDTRKICSVVQSMIDSSSSISIPIALSLHSRYVDSEYTSTLKYAFEVFLNKNGIYNPVDIFEISHKFDKKLLHYFLEYVCTPEVMKLYLYFSSTSEIEDCRIEICKYLVENGDFKESLVDEIKERTRMLVVRKAVKQVENSRIYADTSSFRIGRAKSFKQLFEKFKEIQLQDFSNFTDEKHLEALYSVQKIVNDFEGLSTLIVPHITLNDKNSTFLNLLRRVRDEFAYGDKGLNINLSTRIRHGHLPTTLRKCVTDENLVTLRLRDSNEFKSNNFWLDKLSYLSERNLDKIDKEFNKFSSKYDELIREINDSWLQIWCLDQNLSRMTKDVSKKKALFNYSVSPLEAYSLQKKLSRDSGYEDFLKIAISWMWERTELNLAVVKKKISTEARQNIYTIMDEFQIEILNIVQEPKLVSELFNALGRSRSALSSNLEQIISWFTRSEGTIVEKFDFDTAIEIAMRSANINVAFSQYPQLTFAGNSLSFFVDILYILFENAISKSNLSKDQIDINVNLGLDSQSNIVLFIKNLCKHSGSVEDANKKIQFYRDAYGKDNITKDDVQGEGGTGFFKISKILSKDLELHHINEFGYDDKDLFTVKITILDSYKVATHENSDS